MNTHEFDEIIEDEIDDTVEEEASAEASAEQSADAKRKEFDDAEAKRKAEWDAQQSAKKAADAKALEELAAMSDDDAANASVKRLGTDTERLTRRNMKILVTEFVQTLCFESAAFARLTMHPRKSMVNCFRCINRKAKAFLEQEAKENDEKLSGGVGGDVPDDMVFRWAEDYFRDADAEEDKDADDKFVPKTYYGGGSAKKKEPKPKPEPKKKPAPADSGQLSLMEDAA